MNFLIVTHVVHTKNDSDLVAYAPYVNEMNIWLKYVDKVIIVAPLKELETNPIHQKYQHNNIHFIEVPSFSFINIKEIFKSLFLVPYIFFKIVGAMFQVDHIHLRCPGNMGLLGSLAQIFFPSKNKTTKYAGNWNPKAKQPLSYKFQKALLSNTFLTKKMNVLVYGEWINQTRNIKPFFTATYFENEKGYVKPRTLNNTIHFIFVGSLSEGKQPLYALQLVQKLNSINRNVEISFYGEGKLKSFLNDYIYYNKLNQFVHLKGNVNRDQMIQIYQKSHFLILPSKSEGWPKVIAEAMFWGCLPISTPVSCVPNMLGFGARGILLNNELEKDAIAIENILINQEEYKCKINEAINWSRKFTIDKFEEEIKKLLLQ